VAPDPPEGVAGAVWFGLGKSCIPYLAKESPGEIILRENFEQLFENRGVCIHRKGWFPEKKPSHPF
jgi:hypothetical protein